MNKKLRKESDYHSKFNRATPRTSEYKYNQWGVFITRLLGDRFCNHKNERKVIGSETHSKGKRGFSLSNGKKTVFVNFVKDRKSYLTKLHKSNKKNVAFINIDSKSPTSQTDISVLTTKYFNQK